MAYVTRCFPVLVGVLAVFLFAPFDALSKASAQTIHGGLVRVLILGDSLTDPIWNPSLLAPESTFPADLDTALTDFGYNVEVIPLSRSGDDAYQAYLRLIEWFDAGNTPPDAAIVVLGTNDATRQKDLSATTTDFQMILQEFQSWGVEVLLAGAYAHYPDGRGFTNSASKDAFEVMYMRMADSYHTLLYPYFLSGILDGTGTYTADDLHPNAAGVDLIVDGMLPIVDTLLRKAGAEPISLQSDGVAQ